MLVTEEECLLIVSIKRSSRYFSHSMFGKGLPVAVHEKETLFPTKVTWLSGMSVMLGKPTHKNKHLTVAPDSVQNAIHRKQFAYAVCSRKLS